MNDLRNPVLMVVTFLLMGFGNDSVAWAAGMLFGKNNRGVVAVSPNKSVAGFVGGLVCSMAIGGLAAGLYSGMPEVKAWLPGGNVAGVCAGIVLGLLTGIAGSLGDLAESALKRAAGVKDSGKLIMGRGGVLDSVDSLAFAAPVFYTLWRAFFR
jgi:phosphatidate cytidylyltransferase